MRLLAALAATGLAMAAGGAHAASVEVKDAVARVVVIPEARSDIKVEFLSSNARLPLTVRSLGDRVIIDGDLDRRIRSCHSNGNNIRVRVSGVGEVVYEDMPQIVIRTPKDVNIETGGAVFGAVGKSTSLDLSNAGCGDWTVANVNGQFKIKVHLGGSLPIRRDQQRCGRIRRWWSTWSTRRGRPSGRRGPCARRGPSGRRPAWPGRVAR